MPQSYTRLLYHIVFSTKDRRPLIAASHASALHAYVGGLVRNLDGVAEVVNGTTDHVHLLMSLSATRSLADTLRVLKASSSKWVHEKWPDLRGFGWQNGYGAFSVSESSVDAVRRYIEGQAEHHRKLTFQEEFLALLKKHRIAYDERYIWA